ncbi:MAG: Uncharacterized protein G01um10148_342 [Parcubacteria group bacterium Gr01-1014_8]|nr:MAG: Uncharacterized protein G01um10148_342 [Parcubacteria group bacterium Gr01-1014_8]
MWMGGGVLAALFSFFLFHSLYAGGDLFVPHEYAPFEEQRAYWQHLIEKEGAENALTAFSVRVGSLSLNTQHQLAHSFGAALFQAEGIGGIFICDARYSFGCFHQFLGDAIQALGIERVPDLNTRCFDASSVSPISCTHGIGHGVLASLGYDDIALQKGLEICKGLPGTEPIGGCYGGIFMEYNVRTMLAEQATVREYEGNVYAPCDSLAAEFVQGCIYWQPQWWLVTVLDGVSSEKAYAKMGSYCREFAKTPELLRACFEGLGNIVEDEAEYEPLQARRLCDAAGAGTLSSVYCRSVGANHFGIDGGEDQAVLVCEDLQGDKRAYCMAYAKNEIGLAPELREL